MTNKKPLPAKKGDLDNLMTSLVKSVREKSKSPFLSLGDLQEQFGSNFYIPSGMPSFDMYLYHENDLVPKVDSYGLPTGRIVEFYGPSRSFKTYMTNAFSAQCFKMNGLVFNFSVEKDIDMSFVKKVYLDNGVNFEDVESRFAGNVVDTIEEMKTQFQQITKGIEAIKKETEDRFPVLIIMDSYAMLFGDQELKNYESVTDDRHSNNHLSKNKEAADFFRFVSKEIADKDICFLFTNQVRANLKKTGDKKFLPDKVPVNNDTLEFFSSLRLQMERAHVNKFNANKEIIGHDLFISITKNRSRLIGNGRFKLFYHQNHGFDYFSSLLDAMILSGLIFFSDKEERTLRFFEDIEIYEDIAPLYSNFTKGKQVAFDKATFKKQLLTCIRADDNFLSELLDVIFKRGPSTTQDTREIIW